LAINLKSVAALGITVPLALSARADDALKLFKIAHNELDATICEGTRRVGESRCMDWIKPVNRRGLLAEVP